MTPTAPGAALKSCGALEHAWSSANFRTAHARQVHSTVTTTTLGAHVKEGCRWPSPCRLGVREGLLRVGSLSSRRTGAVILPWHQAEQLERSL